MISINTATSVPDDIAQEAMRRIAENKRKAEEEAREKVICAHMQKLEYDALPKCAHGLPSDAQTWLDHCERYDIYISLHEKTRFKLRLMSVVQARGAEAASQLNWPPLVHCEKCVNDAHVRKQKEEAAKVAAITAEAKRITAERSAERDRQANIARAKHIEDKTAELRGDKTILNFVGLTEPVWTAETYYLRLEDGGKYVLIADGVNVTVRPMLGELSKAPVPTHWATHFTDGLIPFLPICPCCAKPTQMIAAVTCQGYRLAKTLVTVRERYIRSVECNDYNVSLQVPPTALTGASVETHYKWDALSGKHYKNDVEWNPLDPDGAKAAAQHRAAELAAAEKQMAELQAKIQQLKAASDRH